MDTRNSFAVGRVAGIEIRLHASWLLVFGLVAWSLAAGYFPQRYPGWGPGAYWLTGGLTALAFFASVLLHELGHSLVAKARGLSVRRITLFVFGGVSDLGQEPARPADDFLVSIAGPLTSFGLAAACWAARAAITAGAGRGFDATPVGAALGYLAFINLLLGGFNLLPGFPLDGGRVLRAVLWAATGSLRRATQIAAYAGQAVGFLLIFAGITRAFGGAFLDGIWTAFMGWFLSSAAEAARQTQAVEAGLRGIRVAEMMDPQPPVGSPDTSVQEFVYWHVLRHGTRALPIVEHADPAATTGAPGGRLLGLVTVSDVKAVPQTAWALTPVTQVMSRPPLVTVAPDTPVATALRLLVTRGLNQLPVVDSTGRLAGMIKRSDVLRALELGQELHVDVLRPSGSGAAVPNATGIPVGPDAARHGEAA